ncbi:MAG: endolytic transglycosylase MltG [Chloroflexi bacterium]|nr:endolytic transglycosylase MltG [Chloroflexota bacterium]
MKSNFGCFLILGVFAILVFVAFIAGSALLARAEGAFGPPSSTLNVFQRLRIGLELGFRADALLRPADPNAAPVRFDIGLDEPTSQIVSRLWFADLIREGNLFSNYLFYTGLDTQLLAGSYELSASMNSVEIAAALLDPTPETVTLVILPGWRLEEIAAALPSAGVQVTPEEFLLAAWDPPAGVVLPAGFPADSSLEGYLRPGSYEIDREADVIGLLNALLLTFDSTVSAEVRAGFEQQGLTLHQGLTLASIVEREAVNEEEMPLIASVFLNRLDAGIKLEADPTVQYALGYDEVGGTWWKTSLSSTDLAVGSQYNTYQIAGLPPGPIAASTAMAQEAVAFPESSSYFFFQAACDGSGRHIFSVTYEEHIANNCPQN